MARIRRGILAAGLACFFLILMVFADDVREGLQRYATASSDNVQWTLSQSEIEALHLAHATDSAARFGDPSLQEVRRHFDIFYSRVMTLSQSVSFEELRANAQVQGNIDEMRAFLDHYVAVIDGPDEDLRAALPEMARESARMQQLVRATALEGIRIFSLLADARRDDISQTLLRIAVLTLVLILALLVMVGVLLRLVRLRERSAREYRLTRDRMRTIIATSLDAVIVTDLSGRVIEYNGAAERIFGYRRDQALGQDMASLIIPDEMRPAHDAGMHRFRTTGHRKMLNSGVVQLDAKRQDGTTFPVDLSLTAAQTADGEILVGFIRDISDRLRNEDALRAARDRAIAGEKSKAELLAVMSHEMRTPLNGMLGTLELFDQAALDPRHRRYLRIIRNSGRLLLNHVNDVLDISRLDAGKMKMNKTRFDLVALLQEIIDGQAGRAQTNGNVLTLAPLNPMLHEAYSDPDRLRQVLLNLVGNAIKFTQNGRITVEVECHRGLQEVEIRVIDTGVGIDDADLDRIFGDFVTVDASYRRSTGGTGLGLGIARRLTTALGGTLGAESEPGDGSVFWLRLPLDPPAGVVFEEPLPTIVEDTPIEQVELPPLRVLMVEDNEVNRVVAREMLERDGHVVLEAHNGAEGVSLARESAFDAILMDVSMPEMDGLTATRLIRDSGGESADSPIIATTAHAMPDEVRRFREAGMTEVLIKPLSINSLRAALALALLSDDTDDDPEERATMPDPTPQTHALVDRDHLAEVMEDLPSEQFQRVLKQFTGDTCKFVRSMPELVEQEDRCQELSAEAHRMAGSAGVFGAFRLASQMRQMQDSALHGTIEERRALATEIRECWIATRQELDRDGLITLSTS